MDLGRTLAVAVAGLALGVAACLDVPDASADAVDAGVGDARTCAELPRLDAAYPSKVYDFGKPTYCNMEIDSGGWTLVARSAPGGSSTSFGWFSETGTIDDLTKPYSLGLAPGDGWVTEILFGWPSADGLSSEMKTDRVRLVETGFPAEFLDRIVDDNDVEVLTDAYCGAVVPASLDAWGATSSTTRFAMIDATTGLEAGGFEFPAAGNGCSTNASLRGTDGILFVR